MEKCSILFSNDDGISSPGLTALAKQFRSWGETTIVAPAFNQSVSGHALSLHKPLRMERLEETVFAVNGTPADCVHMALTGIFKRKPNFVVSGINQGANLGQDVYYSGTVAAAREGAIAGKIPSFAVSLCVPAEKRMGKINYQYETGAKAAEHVVKTLFRRIGDGSIEAAIKKWPRGLVININVPNIPYDRIKGYRLALQGQQIYDGQALKRKDSRGQEYYWIGGTHRGFSPKVGTDCQWVHEGYVAVTPLEVDCTDHSFWGAHEELFS